MKGFPFYKCHHLGNDFLIFDDRKNKASLREETVKNLCHRHLGIGGDGILLLQNSSVANFRMRIFNADGSEATSCGNGLLCMGKFLQDLGLFEDTLSIETGDGIVFLRRQQDKIALSRKMPYFHIEKGSLTLEEKKFSFSWVHSGVPHVVIFQEPLYPFPVDEVGRKIRHHPLFSPEGTNVNFACSQLGKIQVRTYERGVEGETCSCGTGAMAVAFAAREWGIVSSHLVAISFLHGDVEISFSNGEVLMVGSPQCVSTGIVSVERG